MLKNKLFLGLAGLLALVWAGPIHRVHAADRPSDAQIVGIVPAADQIDIDYGKIALSKSKNKRGA